MLYGIVRLVVNVLAIGISILLVPGLDLVPIWGVLAGLPTLIILAIAFGVVNWLVAPIIMLFLGHLVIWSFGIFIVIINAILLWICTLSFNFFGIQVWPLLASGTSPLVALTLGGALLSLFFFLFEGITGLNSPLKGEDRSNESYWKLLNRLTFGGRNYFAENLRVGALIETISRYARDIVFDSSPFAPFRQSFQRVIYRRKQPLIDEGTPDTVRHMLQDMGPTYVKLGQIISSRAESLPPDWRAALARLQSEVAPFPGSVAMQMVENELGTPVSTVFTSFEQTPFAAASTAQVHRAHLKSGEDVVVKVQRPNIQVTVRSDLNIMRDLSALAESRFTWAKKSDLNAIISDYADNILLELDYSNELLNGQILARNMALFPDVLVPQVYPQYSTPRVLVQEFVRGVKITNVAKLDEAGIDRNATAKRFTRAIIKQVLFDGFFHGDPHPGNVLVDTENGNIIFLDLGMMGTLSQEKRLALADLIWSLSEQDARGCAQTFTRLSKFGPDFNEKRFIEDVERLFQRYMFNADPNAPISMSTSVSATFEAMDRATMSLDPDMTLALKAIVQAEETVRTLDPTFMLVEESVAAAQSLLVETFDPDAVVKSLKMQAIRAGKELVRSIPSIEDAARGWLSEFRKGRFSVYVDTSDASKQIRELDNAVRERVRELILALLLVGMIIGGAIGSTAELDIPQLPQVAHFIFLGASVLAVGLVGRTFWRWLRNQPL